MTNTELLKQAMEARDINVDLFADILDISPGVAERLISGEKEFTVSQIDKLARALLLPVDTRNRIFFPECTSETAQEVANKAEAYKVIQYNPNLLFIGEFNGFTKEGDSKWITAGGRTYKTRRTAERAADRILRQNNIESYVLPAELVGPLKAGLYAKLYRDTVYTEEGRNE